MYIFPQPKMNKALNNGANCAAEKAALSALELIMNHINRGGKSDTAIATHYNSIHYNTEERRVCQCIFLDFLRNKGLTEHFLGGFLHKKPKAKLYAYLCMACSQLVDCQYDKACKRADYSVNSAKALFSVPESKLVNAAQRKFLDYLDTLRKNSKNIEDYALLYSMPLWLAKRFKAQFGEEKTLKILKDFHYQKSVYFRLARSPEARNAFLQAKDAFLPTPFADFYAVKPQRFNDVLFMLKNGYAYAQDPSTSFAVNAVSFCAGQNVLDLCAAPGGKSVYIADILNQKNAEKNTASLLVSCDLPNKRFETLEANFAVRKFSNLKTKQVAFDLLKDDMASKLEDSALPLQYDVVFLDAPCSNTGVLGRRADARYRLTESDIQNCAEIQRQMFFKALNFVKKGGVIVYSTCSIDALENTENVAEFAKSAKLIESAIVLPAADNDGAGYAVFKK